MNIKEFCAVYKVNAEQAVHMTEKWWLSCAEYPGIPEFLNPETIEANFRISDFPDEILPLVKGMGAKLAADPDLSHLAWHAFRCLTHYDGILLGNWPDLDELFDGQGGIFYLLITSAAILPAKAKLKELGIPPEYIFACSRHRGVYDRYVGIHQKPGMTARQALWSRHYAQGTVFRVGRFEYMPTTASVYNVNVYRRRSDGMILATPGQDVRHFTPEGYIAADRNTAAFAGSYTRTGGVIHAISYSPDGIAQPEPVELAESEWELIVDSSSDVLGLHIPEGGKMTPELCGESFKEAFAFFKKYFPEKNFKAIFCASWIFYPYYEQVLPQSNLAALMREIYLFPAPSSGKDGLVFIFGRDDGDYNEYPRDNSMRRAMLDALQNGPGLRVGGMFFLPEHMEQFGQSPYRKAGFLNGKLKMEN